MKKKIVETVPDVNTGDVTVSKGKYRVDLDYIGEGYCGDFNEDDVDDEPLMRFSVFKDDVEMNDGSYCTCISARTPVKQKRKIAQFILNNIYGKEYVKRICEDFSYLHAESVK